LVENIDVPFFTGYSLSASGPSSVAADSKLKLLYSHPKVSLVLRVAKRSMAPPSSPLTKHKAALSLGDSNKTWEPISIARVSDASWNYLRIDWMSNSRVERYNIIWRQNIITGSNTTALEIGYPEPNMHEMSTLNPLIPSICNNSLPHITNPYLLRTEQATK
jgi:hypothetical protein